MLAGSDERRVDSDVNESRGQAKPSSIKVVTKIISSSAGEDLAGPGSGGDAGTQITMDFNQQVDAGQLSIDEFDIPSSLPVHHEFLEQELALEDIGEPEPNPNLYSVPLSSKASGVATSDPAGSGPSEPANIQLENALLRS